MEQKELDSLLQVIENPVRRRIIKRLSQEPGYALQLSKELGLGQPLVAKHLTIMEKAGVVTSAMEVSSSGPRRKKYSVARSVSITMDLAPNLFKERGISFDVAGGGKAILTSVRLRERVREAVGDTDEREKLGSLSRVLEDVDSRVREIEEERVELLEVRNTAMQEAATIVARLELNKKRVLFHILDEHDRAAESISESLNLREFAVRSILQELQKEFFE